MSLQWQSADPWTVAHFVGAKKSPGSSRAESADVSFYAAFRHEVELAIVRLMAGLTWLANQRGQQGHAGDQGKDQQQVNQRALVHRLLDNRGH